MVKLLAKRNTERSFWVVAIGSTAAALEDRSALQVQQVHTLNHRSMENIGSKSPVFIASMGALGLPTEANSLELGKLSGLMMVMMLLLTKLRDVLWLGCMDNA